MTSTKLPVEKVTCLNVFCHAKKNRILVLYSEQSLGLTLQPKKGLLYGEKRVSSAE